MVYEYRSQPFKALYLGYQLSTTWILRFPLWFLLYIPRAWRPRASWSFKRALQIRYMRHMSNVSTKTGRPPQFPNHKAIAEGPHIKGVGLWVQPTPELVVGEVKQWADHAGVLPIRIPGYWLNEENSTLSASRPASSGEKIIYALHGGGYVHLSAAPGADGTSNILYGLLEYCRGIHRTFTVEYRLSAGKPLTPANPFPAALIDALAGYKHLIDVGFLPENIIIEGDSAGANLALALTRYLVENKDNEVPSPPAGIILLSPWADLSNSHHGTNSSERINAPSDFLADWDDGTPLGYAATAFVRPHGNEFAETNRYVSPASLRIVPPPSFKGFPPTFIVAGGAEKLLDSIRTLNMRMSGDASVVYWEGADGFHDFVGFPDAEPERSGALKAIAAWIERGFSSA